MAFQARYSVLQGHTVQGADTLDVASTASPGHGIATPRQKFKLAAARRMHDMHPHSTVSRQQIYGVPGKDEPDSARMLLYPVTRR
jgi:hypothetical protein